MTLNCNSNTLFDPLEGFISLSYGLPTVVLNVFVARIMIMKKEFDHPFYKLYLLYMIACTLKWCSWLFAGRFWRTHFFCEHFHLFFLEYDRLYLLFHTPSEFFFVLSNELSMLLAVNQLTTAFNPLKAKKFWEHYLTYFISMCLTLSFAHIIPCFFEHSVIWEEAITLTSLIDFDGEAILLFYNYSSLVIALVIFILTIYVRFSNGDIAKYANERNMLYIGLTICCMAAIRAVLYILQESIEQAALGPFARTLKRDVTLLSAVYVIIVWDPVLRGFIGTYFKKNTSQVNVVENSPVV